MAASSQLAFLLTHQLAKDDAGSRSEELVAPTLLNSLRLVERAEAEEERGEKGSQGIIHRCCSHHAVVIGEKTEC